MLAEGVFAGVELQVGPEQIDQVFARRAPGGGTGQVGDEGERLGALLVFDDDVCVVEEVEGRVAEGAEAQSVRRRVGESGAVRADFHCDEGAV